MSMSLPNLKENIEKVLSGTPEEKKTLEMSYFYMATTPQILKDHNLTGDYFSVRYGVIARHKGKNANHNLSVQNWVDICDEITRPFAIVKHKGGCRMFVNVKVNNNFAAIGIDVKKVERNIEVNSVSTVFGHEGKVKNSEFIYVKKGLAPEQLALLDGLNYRQYLAAHEEGGTDGDGTPPPPPTEGGSARA